LEAVLVILRTGFARRGVAFVAGAAAAAGSFGWRGTKSPAHAGTPIVTIIKSTKLRIAPPVY
jgi:hypothetical protein